MALIHDTWATSTTPHVLELYYSDAWHDITEDLKDDGISISHQPGMTSEFTCTLNNNGGIYSPRNASSSLYGLIGRNTPLRYSVKAGNVRLAVTGSESSDADYSGAYAPDAAGFAVTDIDARIELDMRCWRRSTPVVGQWGTSNAMWAIYLYEDGRLRVSYTTDGSTINSMYSTAVLPFEVGRHAVRVTLDTDNGASGHTATFYYADSLSDSWTQLGDAVTESGTVTLYASTAALTIGDSYAGYRFDGDVYAFELLDSIGGSAVADPDFTAQSSPTTSFSDDAGNTWTITSPAHCSNYRRRFTGEVSAWPQRWTKKGTCYAPITAAGVRRRLGQGACPLESCYRRAVTTPTPSFDGVLAYWPMEDEAGATQWGSAIPDGHPLKILDGSPSLASNSDFVGSKALPVLDATTYAMGSIALGEDTGQWQVSMLVCPPSGGLSSTGRIMRIITTSPTARQIDLYVTSAGSTYMHVYDQSFTMVYSTASYSSGLNGVLSRVALSLEQNGADIDWMVSHIIQGESTGGYYNQDSSGESVISSATVGRPVSYTISNAYGLEDLVAGHVVVQNDVPSTVFFLSSQFKGYVGEEAHDRVERLAEEFGEKATHIGWVSTELGQQKPETVLDLLTAVEEADLGWVYEPRDIGGLAYRTRGSSEAQDPGITIPYTDNLLLPFEPTEDDRQTRNRVTVVRDGGAGSTYEDTTSLMSTAPPPTGVGLYDEDVTLCLADDTQPPDMARWRVHEGTVNEARWSTIGVELAHPTFIADDDLTGRVLDLDIGDRLLVTDLPEWLSPDDVDQIIQGYSETITPTRYKITFTCTPYSPRRAGRFDDDDAPGPGDARFCGETTESATVIASPRVEFAGSECRSTAATQQTDDLDVRVLVALDDWSPSSQSCVASRYDNAGGANERSWAFDVDTSMHLHCYLSTNGSGYTNYTSTETFRVPDGMPYWLRFLYDASSGDVTFYTSPDGDTWTQLGTTVSGAASGGLYDADADFQLGARSGTSCTSSITGKIIEIHVLDGEDGDALAPTDPTEWTDGYDGTHTGTDEAGGDVTSSATSIDVTTPTGVEWTHDDGDVTLAAAGETMTLTAVSGTYPFQTFTVTRSVNGVEKAQSAGTEIDLFRPTYVVL